MKQHISTEQLNDLSEESKLKLRDWWTPQDGDWYAWRNTRRQKISTFALVAFDSEYGWGDVEPNKKVKGKCPLTLPLLSIGQMIEFLDENNKNYLMEIISFPKGSDFCLVEMVAPTAKELCDALWEAVKEVLKGEK